MFFYFLSITVATHFWFGLFGGDRPHERAQAARAPLPQGPLMEWTGRLYDDVMHDVPRFRLRENDYVVRCRRELEPLA